MNNFHCSFCCSSTANISDLETPGPEASGPLCPDGDYSCEGVDTRGEMLFSAVAHLRVVVVNEWGIHFRSKPPSRQTVYDIRDRFEQHGSVMDAPSSNHLTTVSTDDNLLRNYVVPGLMTFAENFQELYFQHDGAPPHYATAVYDYMNERFQRKVIGRRADSPTFTRYHTNGFFPMRSKPMQIRLDPERQVVRPGDNARITCSATGEQPITINWQSANNQPLPASVRVSGGVIEFLGIQESDAGRYLCKASNMRGILEATADVIVNENNSGSLRAVDRNPSAMEGTNIQLRCDTRDNQRITWSRENGPLPSRASIQGHILQIDNLQLGDAGRYICQTDIYGQSSHTSAQDYIDLRVELNPCTLDEFSCKNRQCIPLLQVCDGILHCSDGSDEATCQIRPGRGWFQLLSNQC
ncbi:Basement membrane-specific heparan sulfate proteoglycan core protein [Homalodisca vitripennis]|nr:Basement membrane-specific heparan sulfate proteoglycan core protein [Homalodisca vitripennis]